MSICGRNRVPAPNGSWGYKSIVGAKVRLRSTPVSNFFGSYCASDTYTVKDVLFQISLDGKAITILELVEIEGKFFTLKDVQFVELSIESSMPDAVCGTFDADETIVGRNVSHDLTCLEDLKVAIVDENGNIFINGYLKIEGNSIVKDNFNDLITLMVDDDD